jgi:hypothetical protein
MGWYKGGGTIDPAVWVQKVKDAPRNAINAACFEAFKRVVMDTPVDTGAARGSWLCTPDQPADDIGVPDTNGTSTINNIAVALENIKGDSAVFLTSNLPYMKMLEFGGYGKAKGQGESLIGRTFPGRGMGRIIVKITRGTVKGERAAYYKWLKDHAPPKITPDGFSKQAPRGMVAKNMMKFNYHLKKAIEIFGGST